MKSLTFRHSANFTQQRFFSERNRAFSKVYKRSFCRNTLAGSCLFKSCQKMSQFQVRVDRGWTWLDCEKKAETLPVVVLKNLARVFFILFRRQRRDDGAAFLILLVPVLRRVFLRQRPGLGRLRLALSQERPRFHHLGGSEMWAGGTRLTASPLSSGTFAKRL